MKKLGILFNTEEDGQRPKLLLGTFPAHIIKWTKGDPRKDIKTGTESIPFNPIFKIAPEAANMVGEDINTGVELSAKSSVGLSVSGKGIWLCTNPTPEEKWKNINHFEFCEALKIKLPEKEVDGKVYKELVELQALDVLGKPLLITIGIEINNKDTNKPYDQQRKYAKVFKTLPWDGDSYEIDPSEFIDPSIGF